MRNPPGSSTSPTPTNSPPVIRSLPVNYALWLLEKCIEADRGDEAENLIKELTIWSRQAEGTFSPEQDAQLKIAYADLAFRKGALPTARAWYRKVAEAAEYEGTESISQPPSARSPWTGFRRISVPP
jgi:hypothetical protein